MYILLSMPNLQTILTFDIMCDVSHGDFCYIIFDLLCYDMTVAHISHYFELSVIKKKAKTS